MNPDELRQTFASTRTVADRVVGWLNPDRGLARLRSRAMLAAATGDSRAGGYEGGRRDRRGTKRWRPPEGSADSDTLPDLPDLRSRARDLERNVPIATGAIATKSTNVIGTGSRCRRVSIMNFSGLPRMRPTLGNARPSANSSSLASRSISPAFKILPSCNTSRFARPISRATCSPCAAIAKTRATFTGRKFSSSKPIA
jgi:hypothetical protein